jgi:hypothetical protein
MFVSLSKASFFFFFLFLDFWIYSGFNSFINIEPALEVSLICVS